MWNSFVAILRKEFKHVFRDRGTIAMFFMLPIMQLSLFGFLDQNVRHLPAVVVDQDQTRYSRELMDQLKATQTFEIAKVTNSPDEARAMIAQGTARLGIVIPPDFHDKRVRGGNAQFLALIDGSDSNVSAQALGAINGVVSAVNLDHAAKLGAKPQLSAQPIILFNPEGRTANYIIPGLVAILLQIAAMVLASIAIVRETFEGSPSMPNGVCVAAMAGGASIASASANAAALTGSWRGCRPVPRACCS